MADRKQFYVHLMLDSVILKVNKGRKMNINGSDLGWMEARKDLNPDM